MNPNASQLDPKLKEAYDRVMGTELPKVASPLASDNGQGRTELASSPAGQARTDMSPPASGARQGWEQSPSRPQTFTPPPAQSASPTVVTVEPQTVIKPTPQGEKKKIPAVLFIILGIILLGAYTFLWLNVFNVTLF